MKSISLNQNYYLDVGSLSPIEVRTLKFLEVGVLCEYLSSYQNRIEIIDYELFQLNGYIDERKYQKPHSDMKKIIAVKNKIAELITNRLSEFIKLGYRRSLSGATISSTVLKEPDLDEYLKCDCCGRKSNSLYVYETNQSNDSIKLCIVCSDEINEMYET